jgi:hypothetical protein
MASNEECVARLFLEPNRLQLDWTRAPNNLAYDELPEIQIHSRPMRWDQKQRISDQVEHGLV